MKTLYLDAFSGISGDMFLGGLLDLGLELSRLESELEKLGWQDEYQLQVERGQRSNVSGARLDVRIRRRHDSHHHHHHGPGPGHVHGRNFSEIRERIESSALSPWVRKNAVETFARIARAEGRVHGLPPEEVHFHEVGAVDSIVDIVGAAIALELLGRPEVRSSEVVEGRGWVECAHGRFPLPAMATLAILGERGIELSQTDESHELVTPTGAALLAQYARSFGPMQGLVADRIGYGLGSRQLESRPNVLRMVLCGKASSPDLEEDRICELRCNLDDDTPENLGHALERVLQEGALDAFHTPVQMKKNRPAALFTVLCRPEDARRLARLALEETSGFGIRVLEASRLKLSRKPASVDTPWGAVAVKLGFLDGRLLRAVPEHDSCRRVAEESSASLREVREAALARCRTRYPRGRPMEDLPISA